MLGSDLMMAPIFEAGVGGRSVYIPRGKWTHLFTGEEFNFGGKGGRL